MAESVEIPSRGWAVAKAEATTPPLSVGSRRSATREFGDSALREALAALKTLSESSEHAGGWVGTGAVADAIDSSMAAAAARLRAAQGHGLCAVRRSLRDGTTWRPTAGNTCAI